MIIGIQRGLDGVKSSLQNRGYHVVEVNHLHSAPVDVYIYNGHEGEYSIAEITHSIPAMGAMINTVEQRGYQGTFLINSAHRSIEEIETMIHRKTYTPLF